MSGLTKYIKPAELGFLALVALYVVICWGITLYTGLSEHFSPIMYLGTGLQMTGTFLLAYLLYRLGRAVYIMIAKRPKKLALALYEDLKAGPLRGELYLRALPILIGFIIFFSTFTSMKTLIPHIHPFGWDEFFMEVDQAIHFGIDPWRLLQPILGHSLITKIISFVYILWLPIFFLVLYWQLFRLQDETLRMRFFYCFALSWAINGTFLAITFSSAGPCFYEPVIGSDYYAPLMEYLQSVHEEFKIYAISTQELVWNNYKNDGSMIGGGISAFPSIHVATAFLFVLLSWHMHPFVRWGVVVFFGFILIGSIHLAWHYAVDGYFSILTTWGLWWVSGRLIKRHCERTK